MEWWQTGIVYQVYPRSFRDSDGDGTGDLPGIIAGLEHLVWLGVDAVWISPVYPSPMTDFGYDVSDYCAIDPLFGTLADFDTLVARAHALGLRVILDFVPNHTSDQHEWFIDSRNRRNGREDWYIWRDAAPGGGPPTNWLSNFAGPAWGWDDRRGQYYYHAFLPTQPDLNWRNPAVVAAMHDAMRFWLRRGVDGFRVDVMWMMIKDDQFRDDPPNPAWHPGMSSHDRLLPVYTADRPEVHDVVAGMRAVTDEFPARVLIGELYLPIDRLVTYYGLDGKGAQLPFNFQLLLLQDWSASAIADIITRYEAELPPGAWPNWVLGNHDRPRIASRIGPAQARVAAMLLLTLRGTPTVYMGEELGMIDTPIPPAAVRDPAELREPGKALGRDPERTPFPWTDAPGHDFTTGTPWLPFGADTPLSQQREDAGSMLQLYRRLTSLRRANPTLATGAITNVRADGPVLRYERTLGDRKSRVVLNLGVLPAAGWGGGKVAASTHSGRVGTALEGGWYLQPNEGVVLDIEPPG
ncbi:alpha-amylase family glycosyl hydrolase [Acidisphaera sp. L21]|uniref:alpha-amylase family glycosyl hydrolase n=1 Tax=Acidisphaera sp. L21 TaxID=1641851 RepID=UPI00131E88B1|nr:alpha-amylase family glycosyl hydrolase [Acidisphaera sp. L21]